MWQPCITYDSILGYRASCVMSLGSVDTRLQPSVVLSEASAGLASGQPCVPHALPHQVSDQTYPRC